MEDEQTIGETVEKRKADLKGVIDGTVIVHQWGVRDTPRESNVLHELAIPSSDPEVSLTTIHEHLVATRNVAEMIPGIHAFSVRYLGRMTVAEASAELSTLEVKHKS